MFFNKQQTAFFSMTFSQDDHKMARVFDDFWGTFAETGKPSPSTKGLGDFIMWPEYVSIIFTLMFKK